MTTPILRLESGRTIFDLNNQVRFFLHQDFLPPAVSVTPLFAAGTSANRDGAQLVDKRPTNRSFTFRVNMRGNSTLEMKTWTARLQALLNRAGNEQEPVYLVWKDNSDTPEPLWGQHGSATYYEVVYGRVDHAPGYLVGNRIATDFDLEFALVLKPFATSNSQRVASAMGRLHEDVLGTTDGQSRGLVLGRNHTNKCTNPVFGNSTWNTGWTADASLTASQNIYQEYILHGATASALLVSRSTGQEFYQSINVGNTQTHTFLALVMRPDFGTVTSDDVVLFYSSALTSTFTDLGNGLWAVTATATGINASTNTGIQVKNGRSIYLLYYGVVDTDDAWFYPFWGDNLGCAWSGTAHNSTSTSTAGRVRLPVASDTVSIAQGSIRMVLKLVQNANFVNPVFWSFGASSLRAGLTLSTMTLTLTDNTNTASSSASAVTAGQTVCLHWVWGSDGLKIYLNGAVVASNGTFTLPSAPTYLYLGTDDTPTAQTENPIHDIAIWSEQLTAAQISADYDTIDELMDDRLRVAPFPWLWTKDGDDVVDNHDDSGEDNWCVVGGVAGSEAAVTEYTVLAAIANETAWIAVNPTSIFYSPTNFYSDLSGTVDAGSSGGEYAAQGLTTSSAAAGGITLSSLAYEAYLAGREVRCFSRTSVSSSSLLVALQIRFGTSAPFFLINSDFSTTNASSSFGLQVGPALFAPTLDRLMAASGVSVAGYIGELQKAASGTPTRNIDYLAFVVGNLIKLVSTAPGADKFILKEYSAIGLDSSNNSPTEIIAVQGNSINVTPDTYNILVSFLGDLGTDRITQTLTYTIKITPRYTLL